MSPSSCSLQRRENYNSLHPTLTCLSHKTYDPDGESSLYSTSQIHEIHDDELVQSWLPEHKHSSAVSLTLYTGEDGAMEQSLNICFICISFITRGGTVV